MARIMKVRTIPRGYVGMDDLKEFVRRNDGRKPSEWFMALYTKFGNPQDGGMWSYLLRHNNVVMKVTAKDSDTMDYGIWVSPAFVQDARRKRTKVMNVIARRLNENDVPFVPSEGESLYYAVRVKNDVLLERQEDPKRMMENNLTDEEREALYGPVSQFMDDVRTELTDTISEIFDEKQ